jgi:hypothetical protein
MPPTKADLERSKERIERRLTRAQERAVKKVGELANATRAWNERTVGDVVTLKLAETAASEIKAKRAAAAAPAQLGVIVIANRVESLDEWERQYQAMEADLRERRSLPAVATVVSSEKKPAGE